ncbi:MAG: EAL domain-containing protein [Oscillospiraceae bacterium]|nr:EAL domain-containing protein [Oscillospiraceae bacterium]
MNQTSGKQLLRKYYVKLVLPVLALNAVLLFAFTATLVAAARMQSNISNAEFMTSTGEFSAMLVRDYMNAKNTWVDLIADAPEVSEFLTDTRNSKSIEEIKAANGWDAVMNTLEDSMRFDPDVRAAWVASEANGILITNSGNYLSDEEFALKSRSWYREFLTSRSSRVYYNSTLSKGGVDYDEDVVTIVSAIYENEYPLGYCGIEVSLSGLTAFLEKYTLTGDYFTIITSKFGDSIYAPEVGVSDEIYAIALSSAGLETGLETYAKDNQTMFYFVDSSEVNGWTIFVFFESGQHVISSLDFKDMISVLLIITGGMTIIGFVLISHFLQRKTYSLYSIEEAVGLMANGKYSEHDVVTGKSRMLDPISQNLNQINKALAGYERIIKDCFEKDVLTGLSNRLQVYGQLDTLIKRADEKQGKLAIMFIDLDNFKWLNETLGHTFGDEVLKAFSKELKACVGSNGLVFRFSGDEFVILTELEELSGIEAVTSKLQEAFGRTVKVMNDNIYIKFSGGVAFYPDDGISADLLSRNADIALKRAKESGKGRLAYYRNTLLRPTRSISKAALGQKLHSAMDNNEFYINYQPIITADSGNIYGFEALLRWESPELGVVPTSEFIEVAEETGEIIRMGMWIFENACRFLKEINARYGKDLSISINVSPLQLKRADYVEHIRRVIDIMSINPSNIQLEITESTIVDFASQDPGIIAQLDEMGISLALDDFGTGYSSMNHLKNYPIKYLKIDKEFIDEISSNKKDYDLIDSLIELVHNLGIKTIAEGIETIGQYDFLVKMRCDYIQGFLMSKPLDKDAAFEFVERYEALHKPNKENLLVNERQLAVEREQSIKENAEEQAAGEYPENIIISN